MAGVGRATVSLVLNNRTDLQRSSTDGPAA
ncbi:LacI family DNA-binding transcriptional regulator [Actinokineospora sp. PR83]|nr:LacI family DNA-binding transcriptional regulator [Actinokineospora sp. PR83]